jgi:hypothetical protein
VIAWTPEELPSARSTLERAPSPLVWVGVLLALIAALAIIVLSASSRVVALESDLRGPVPAGPRWVASDDSDHRLTVALEPMPVDWLVCLEWAGGHRCGLESEWKRWDRELETLHARRTR